MFLYIKYSSYSNILLETEKYKNSNLENEKTGKLLTINCLKSLPAVIVVESSY